MPRTHRIYEKDFRQEAVNLLLSSGRPLKRVAAELGIAFTLAGGSAAAAKADIERHSAQATGGALSDCFTPGRRPDQFRFTAIPVSSRIVPVASQSWLMALFRSARAPSSRLRAS